jgi:hypothetical protein
VLGTPVLNSTEAPKNPICSLPPRTTQPMLDWHWCALGVLTAFTSAGNELPSTKAASAHSVMFCTAT